MMMIELSFVTFLALFFHAVPADVDKFVLETGEPGAVVFVREEDGSWYGFKEEPFEEIGRYSLDGNRLTETRGERRRNMDLARVVRLPQGADWGTAGEVHVRGQAYTVERRENGLDILAAGEPGDPVFSARWVEEGPPDSEAE